MAITLSMNDNDTTTATGQIAENLAARFLEKHGLTVAARNYRCRGGEIDLVCRDGTGLVFVEVRLRRNAEFGGAAASITAAKQRRIVLAAQHYLAAHRKHDRDCRFDCLLLDGTSERNIEWVKNAFSAD